MKKVLFIYSKMVIGGSTTSLLSLLNSFDYKQYSVDLLLYDNSGELQDQINENVTILPEMKSKTNKFAKILNPMFWKSLVKARIQSKKNGNKLINAQYMSKYEAISSSALLTKYDVAVSFLEFWPMEYLARRVYADLKIGWIHIDPKEAGLLPNVSNDTLSKLDNIVLVSNSCVEHLKDLYPDHQSKMTCIENILVSKTIQHLSENKVDICINLGEFNFVSVCRLVLASKGLDRGINAFKKLKSENLLSDSIKWFIIGDGPDRNQILTMIKDAGLEKSIILLGQHKNPYAIEKDMNVFLLPSRYEGKPMAVTEAQMLGLVPVVCNYSSASEQIQNEVDGLIANNDETDIYNKIKGLLCGTYNYQELQSAVKSKDYSNHEEIYKVFALLEGAPQE